MCNVPEKKNYCKELNSQLKIRRALCKEAKRQDHIKKLGGKHVRLVKWLVRLIPCKLLQEVEMSVK